MFQEMVQQIGVSRGYSLSGIMLNRRITSAEAYRTTGLLHQGIATKGAVTTESLPLGVLDDLLGAVHFLAGHVHQNMF